MINNDYPLIHSRQIEVYDNLSENMPANKYHRILPNLTRYFWKNFGNTQEIDEGYLVNYGIQTNKKASEYTFQNINNMKIVCESQGIKYVCILQPWLGCFDNPKYRDILKEKIELAKITGIAERRKTYQELREKTDGTFFFDFSSVFEEYDALLIYPLPGDICHVSRFGNEILADKIYTLLPQISQLKQSVRSP